MSYTDTELAAACDNVRQAPPALQAQILRGMLAEAWDEGFDACFDVSGEPCKQDVPSPYRTKGE